MESHINGTGVMEKEVRMANQRRVGICESLVRILALLLTLAAAIVLGLDKKTIVVPTLAAIYVPVTVKWHYLSAFVYLVVANAIACVSTTFSLVLSFANRGTKKNSLRLLIIVLDLLMVALLFSATGATGAIGLMAYQGNSHVQWNKVCNMVGKFCHPVVASVVLSQLAALAFLFLVVFAVLGLNKTSN